MTLVGLNINVSSCRCIFYFYAVTDGILPRFCVVQVRCKSCMIHRQWSRQTCLFSVLFCCLHRLYRITTQERTGCARDASVVYVRARKESRLYCRFIAV